MYQQGYIYVHIYPIKIGIGVRLCGIQLITRAPIGAWEVKLEIMTYQLTNLPIDQPTDRQTEIQAQGSLHGGRGCGKQLTINIFYLKGYMYIYIHSNTEQGEGVVNN